MHEGGELADSVKGLNFFFEDKASYHRYESSKEKMKGASDLIGQGACQLYSFRELRGQAYLERV